MSDTLTGYTIIIVHLFFVIGLATAIIFVQALADYIEYVIIGGVLLTGGSLLFFYRKFKKNGRQLVNTIRQASTRYNQDIKIDFLGGMASISINNRGRENQAPIGLSREGADSMETVPALPQACPEPEKSPAKLQSELLRLVELLDRQLIDKEEFEQLKKSLMSSNRNEDK